MLYSFFLCYYAVIGRLSTSRKDTRAAIPDYKRVRSSKGKRWRKDSGITSSIKAHIIRRDHSFFFLIIQSDYHHRRSCVRLYLSGHLRIVPRVGEHKCFIESPRDSSLCRSLCRWKRKLMLAITWVRHATAGDPWVAYLA